MVDIFSYIDAVTTPSRLISQSIDFLCYDVIMKPKERMDSFKTLEELLRKVDHRKMAKFGRLQCSVTLANLIMDLTRRDTVTDDHQDDYDAATSILEYWDNSLWKEFFQKLHEAKEILCRKDAHLFITAPITGYSDNDGKGNSKSKKNNKKNKIAHDIENSLENNELNEVIASNPLFTHKFDEVLSMCLVQSALSYLRVEVNGNDDNDSELLLDKEEVDELYAFIQEYFNKDDRYYDILMSLFEENNSHTLKKVAEINTIMTKKFPSLDRFRRITERLLQNWYINVFHEPVLVAAGFTSSYRDQSEKDYNEDLSTVFDKKKCDPQVENDKHHNSNDDGSFIVNDGYESNGENSSLDDENDQKSKRVSKRKRVKTNRLIDELSKQTREKVEVEEDNESSGETMSSTDRPIARNKRQTESSSSLFSDDYEAYISPKKSQTKKKCYVFDVSEVYPFDPAKAIQNGNDRIKAYKEKLHEEQQRKNDTEEFDGSSGSATSKASAKRKLDKVQAKSGESSSEKRKADDGNDKAKVKPKQKRRKWTEDEKNAIRKGFKEFGFKWQKIKEEHSEVLGDRTNVQIKDCFRTLVKNDDL